MRSVLIWPVLMLALGLALAACSKSSMHGSRDPFAGQGSPYYKGSGPLPKGGGRYHVGQPYEVAGRWFTPKEQPNYDKTGPASWYGEAFHRRMTSNGEWFDMKELTAAHATLPLPSYVKVTNLDNGREVIVRVNDRGPFVGPRIIDMSKRAAEVLGFKRQGRANVRVQYVGNAPLNDQGRHLAAMNRELQRGTPLRKMLAAASRDRGTTQVAEITRSKPVVVAVAPSMPRPEQVTSMSSQAYFVQVGSFADPENAERARAQLATVWPMQVIDLAAAGGTLYRVRVGPIATATDAETALEEAVAYGHPDAHIIVAATQQAAL